MDDQFPNSTEGNEHLARTIAGLSNGMIAPTLGSFLSMTAQLIESGHLWRTQQRLLLETTERNTYSDVERVIVPVILRSLYSRPVPDIVHRTNSEPVPCSFSAISGNPIAIDSDAGHELRAGSRVILGIESATHDVDVPNKLGDAEVIFGGKYIPGASTGTHACSGARMAVGILAGMLTALLEAGNLKLENAPLTLSRNATD